MPGALPFCFRAFRRSFLRNRIERIEVALGGHELVKAAAFDDPAGAHRQDPVAAAQERGIERVRHNDARKTVEPQDGIHDTGCGFPIKRCGRFVNEQNGRALEKASCDRNALPFAAGELI